MVMGKTEWEKEYPSEKEYLPETQKFCPLKKSEYNECSGMCAWYDESNKKCAVVNIAIYLYRLFERGEQK